MKAQHMHQRQLLIERLNAAYGIRITSLSRVHLNSFNAHYVAVTSNGKLHVIEYLPRKGASSRNSSDIGFAHELVDYLVSSGFGLVIPFMRTRSGTSWVEFAGSIYAVNRWETALPRQVVGVERVTMAGEALAYLHQALAGWSPPRCRHRERGLRFARLDKCVRMCMDILLRRLRDEQATAVKVALGELVCRLERLLATCEVWYPAGRPEMLGGVVHGDFQPRNVAFAGPRISSIRDFDLAFCEALLYDVAYGIAFFSTQYPVRGPLDRRKALAFVQGYQAAGGALSSELAALPFFVAAVVFKQLCLSRLPCHWFADERLITLLSVDKFARDLDKGL